MPSQRSIQSSQAHRSLKPRQVESALSDNSKEENKNCSFANDIAVLPSINSTSRQKKANNSSIHISSGVNPVNNLSSGHKHSSEVKSITNFVASELKSPSLLLTTSQHIMNDVYMSYNPQLQKVESHQSSFKILPSFDPRPALAD